MMNARSLLVTCAVTALAFGAAIDARAVSFHLMQIEQIVGGVNGDTSAQAIQLRMRGSQPFVRNGRMRVWDAAGANPITIIDFTTNVVERGCGVRILIASTNFANYLDPVIPIDFTLENLIPDSYLAAGSLTFEADNGTVHWRVCWGGNGYTGATNMNPINDDDGDVAPPWHDVLPSSGLQALQFQGACGDTSTTNAEDYELTQGAAVVINNAGDSSTITLPPADLVDVNVIEGTHSSGGLPELRTSDNQYYATAHRITGEAAETHRLQYTLGAETPLTSGDQLTITFEGRTGDTNTVVTLFLRDWNGGLEQVAQFSQGFNDTTEVSVIANANQYIRQADGRIEMLVKKHIVLPSALAGTPSFDDLIRIAVE